MNKTVGALSNIDVIRNALRTLNQCVSARQDQSRCLDSFRVFHGRGQCYNEGLQFITLDWHHPCLVLIYFADPGPEFDELLLNLIHEVSVFHQCIYAQHRYRKNPEFECVRGVPPSTLYAHRQGQKYKLSLSQQNIGFFLDSEPARLWLEYQCQISPGAKLLNLFSYTCVFSVVAKLSGAATVLNMDLSSKSLELGRDNHRLNAVTDGVKYFSDDILKSWGRMARFGPFDIVICDPPSYQKGSFVASKDYKKVLRRVSDLVKVRGKILLCLNAPEWSELEFRNIIEKHLSGFKFERRLDVDTHFPDANADRSLKSLVYQRLTSFE